MSEPCRLRLGIFNRWYIFHPHNITKAWSGSSWVPSSVDGFPTGDVQVCNFVTERSARDYCRENGLEPIDDA
jgi:hypothetical protein